MRNILIGLFASASVALPSLADEWDEFTVWESEGEIGATSVVALEADEPALFRLWAERSVNRVLDNGVVLGAKGRLELQKDHPSRAGFSGVPAGFDLSSPALQGAFSGLSISATAEDTGPRARFEQAYVYMEGGYGELRIGWDEGVAARFQEGAPSIFDTLAAGRQRLDPSGLDVITVRHDLTGPSAKLSYTTPRILGLRGGLSFTPAAATGGLDRDADRNLPGAAPISIDNAIEASANLSRRLQKSGVRLRASAAASTADVETPAYASGVYDRVTTWSVGASAEFETVTLGATYLSSDNGIRNGSGDYEAWTAGITKAVSDYVLGAEYGEAKDALTGLDGDVWAVGVSRAFSENAKFSLGYREYSLDGVYHAPSFPVLGNNSFDGVVVEITLSH